MGFQDRHYYRERNRRSFNPLTWLLTGSVPLFTVFGIRVRAHASLIILIALELIFSETNGGLGAQNAIVSMTILFLSVLLHEFGHCFGARWVGGDADEILMWPLGGLAMTRPPHRPWASFVSTAAGPGVNVLICVITGTAICVMQRSIAAIPWLPIFQPLRDYIPVDWTTYYLWWIFLVNYGILVFNVTMVFYPFDGGRMVQEILWAMIGYYRSMRIATVVGMVGAVFVAAFAMAWRSPMLFFIAVFGFIACYQQRQVLRAAGPEEFADDGTDYSAAYETFRPPPRVNKRAARRALKIARAEREERQRIDQILAKVSAHGMHSLTWLERRALKKATEHQRERDRELGRVNRL